MKLDPSRAAIDFLLTLNAKPFRQVMRKTLALLRDPRPPDSEALRGYEGLRRADIGEFRIIYRIETDTVVVELIGRRNDDAVYRVLDRRR